MAKRISSRQFVTVFVSLIISCAVQAADLTIGNLGSSPLAAADSRNLPIVAFIVSAQINTSEALVVRNGSGIDKPEDLIGNAQAQQTDALLKGGTATAIGETAKFLKEQGEG